MDYGYKPSYRYILNPVINYVADILLEYVIDSQVAISHYIIEDARYMSK